jgi:hypothetical protein
MVAYEILQCSILPSTASLEDATSSALKSKTWLAINAWRLRRACRRSRERARTFYERYGFRAFASERRRLFLPLETFEKLKL